MVTKQYYDNEFLDINEHAKELVDGLLLKEREVIMIEEEDKQKVVQTIQILGGHIEDPLS